VLFVKRKGRGVKPRPKTKVFCMANVAALRRLRNRFQRRDVRAAWRNVRRKEIIKHARYVGAADSDDFSRWLVQWAVHNPTSRDEIWAVMNAAVKMGGKITEGEAAAICDEAALIEHFPMADHLAKVLGVTYTDRQTLKLTTI